VSWRRILQDDFDIALPDEALLARRTADVAAADLDRDVTRHPWRRTHDPESRARLLREVAGHQERADLLLRRSPLNTPASASATPRRPGTSSRW
jgi:hypothetical protein